MTEWRVPVHMQTGNGRRKIYDEIATRNERSGWTCRRFQSERKGHSLQLKPSQRARGCMYGRRLCIEPSRCSHVLPGRRGSISPFFCNKLVLLRLVLARSVSVRRSQPAALNVQVIDWEPRHSLSPQFSARGHPYFVCRLARRKTGYL